jgi:exoribonuclease-2
MIEHDLLPEFEQSVLRQLRGIGGPATPPMPIRDLRGLLWASIDNDNSLDLDQLSVAEHLASGQVKVLVAIADVDVLVKKASPIDAHAQHNTTSVYTAAQVFPMLPERLSTDLTSLGEGQERLAIVIEMLIDSEGVVVGSDAYRAIVLNHAKLAYNSVTAWLSGQGPMPPQVAAVGGLADQLRLQDSVAQALRTQRAHRGALTLQTVESRAVFDGDVLTDLQPQVQNRAQALIEDFMIAANGVTVRYLEAKGVPALRRVLRTPEHWDRIVELAAEVGEHLPSAPDPNALQTFLSNRQQADPLRFPDLSLTIIKLLGSGEYVVEIPGQAVEGHFGLAVTAYTHSTAPNRRYPDLITQRLLKATMGTNPIPYNVNELRVLAQHCTDQEDNVKKVERQVQKSAAALLLVHRVGEHFEGIVTGASEKGTWVRIVSPPVEGKVIRGFQGLHVGDKLEVELVDTNVERGYIDFGAGNPR